NQNHFVVFVNSSRFGSNIIYIADPGKGLISLSKKEFVKHWVGSPSFSSPSGGGRVAAVGTALLLEPTPYFYEQEGEKEDKLNWNWVLQYLKKSKWMISQVFIALVIACKSSYTNSHLTIFI
ncbi:MAG: cysteine peptidase family C39 domain-containing protein, partial [Chitinophagaceae bacterium]